MTDDLARAGDEHEPAKAAPTPTPDETSTPQRPPLMSVLLRQVGTLAGGALLGQATWGTPWFVGVVAVVVLIEGLIVWDWRHPKRRS